MHLKREVSPEVVDSLGSREGVGVVLVGVGGHIAHSQGVDWSSREVDLPEDDDLTSCR